MIHRLPESPGRQLRELWSGGCVLMPGVFNGISAVSARKAGAKALYLTGAGLSNGVLGVPDIGLMTQTEFAQQSRYVVNASGLPVLSDADTGFGSPLNVFRTVREMAGAGLAGLHLEDQVNPKRCGHLDGKSVVSAGDMGAKVRAAVDAKTDPSFVICARTDARAIEGLEAAIERANHYVDCGADAVFPEGLQSVEEFRRFRDGVSAPLLANMTEFGKTPLIPFADFANMGYQMVIYPMTAFRVMHKALDDSYQTLLSNHSQEALLANMRTRAELYEAIDYADFDAMDANWADPR
jgi:methylisocitrate lyase